MAYIGSSPTKVVSRQSANIFTYTATANQTAFTGADVNGNTLACSPSDIMVHMNGIKLEESDYTATTTTVTLSSGAAAGDEVTITAFLTFESADHYTKSAADTRYVNTTGDTMTGNLTVSGGLVSATGTSTNTNPDADIGLYHSFKNLSSDVNTGVAITMGSNNSGSATIYAQRTGANNEHKMGFQTRDSSGAGLTRMAISGSGIITKPYNPWFDAKGTGGWSTLAQYENILNVFNGGTVYQNSGGGFNSSTSTYTAPVSGRYCFLYNTYTKGGSTSTAARYLYPRLYVNNSPKQPRENIQHYNGENADEGRENTIMIDLAANDTVKCGAWSSHTDNQYYGSSFHLQMFFIG